MPKEYISREAAIAETRKPRLTDAELRRRLAAIPAADVRPVVLCRDCYAGDDCYINQILREDCEAEEPFCAHGKRCGADMRGEE